MTSGLRGLQALQGLQVTVITLSSLLLLPNPEVVSDSLVWLVLVSQEPQDLVFRNFLLLSASPLPLRKGSPGQMPNQVPQSTHLTVQPNFCIKQIALLVSLPCSLPLLQPGPA